MLESKNHCRTNSPSPTSAFSKCRGVTTRTWRRGRCLPGPKCRLSGYSVDATMSELRKTSVDGLAVFYRYMRTVYCGSTGTSQGKPAVAAPLTRPGWQGASSGSLAGPSHKTSRKRRGTPRPTLRVLMRTVVQAPLDVKVGQKGGPDMARADNPRPCTSPVLTAGLSALASMPLPLPGRGAANRFASGAAPARADRAESSALGPCRPGALGRGSPATNRSGRTRFGRQRPRARMGHSACTACALGPAVPAGRVRGTGPALPCAREQRRTRRPGTP